MPTEIRRIIYSRDELAAAITNYENGASRALPTGRIVYCRIRNQAELGVEVKMIPNGGSDIKTVQLEANLLGSILIDDCARRKIPIPRNASKSLEVIGEAIAIMVSTDLTTAPLIDPA